MDTPEFRHEFERRLHEEIGCAEGCECLSPAILLAGEMCDRIAELEGVLRRIDAVTTWETTPLGRSFQDEIEAALRR